jgi:hypothetical protein
MKIISNTKYKLSFFSLISKRSLIKISLTETEIDHQNVHMILTESNNSNHNKYGIDQAQMNHALHNSEIYTQIILLYYIDIIK